MATFGESVFGTTYFGDGEEIVQPPLTATVGISVEVTIVQGPVGDTLDMEPVDFAASGGTVGPSEVQLGAETAALGATGALSGSATVEPLGDVVDAPTGQLEGSGGLDTLDATVMPGGVDIDAGTVTFRASGGLYGEPIRQRLEVGRVHVISPTAAIRGALEASRIATWRAVDILNSDETLWANEVNVTEGSVSIDVARDERRTLQMTLEDLDHQLKPVPNGFWYDKIIRVRRGVHLDGVKYEFDLGYFMIDQLGSDPTGAIVTVSGRDYTKKMLKDKTAVATSFPVGLRIETLVRNLALTAGINRVDLPNTGKTLETVASFDADTPRWEICKQVANSYGYEVFFRRDGALTMERQADPVNDAEIITIGASAGNAIEFTPSTNDGELYNHVVVVASSGGTEIPVWAEVENRVPGSPTHVDRIGRRTKRIESALVTTQESALTIARNNLRVSALEQFESNFSALNYPWLDVGKVIEIDDPNASEYDPTRFLLATLEIPLAVGPMTGTARRVTIVEDGTYNVQKTWMEDNLPQVSWGDLDTNAPLAGVSS